MRKLAVAFRGFANTPTMYNDQRYLIQTPHILNFIEDRQFVADIKYTVEALEIQIRNHIMF